MENEFKTPNFSGMENNHQPRDATRNPENMVTMPDNLATPRQTHDKSGIKGLKLEEFQQNLAMFSHTNIRSSYMPGQAYDRESSSYSSSESGYTLDFSDYKSFSNQDVYVNSQADHCDTVKELIIDDVNTDSKMGQSHTQTPAVPQNLKVYQPGSISEIAYTDAGSDAPGCYFEDLEQIDQRLLNEYEKCSKFNAQFIKDFWTLMDSFGDSHWDLRADKEFGKCWTAKKGSPYNKKLIWLKVNNGQ